MQTMKFSDKTMQNMIGRTAAVSLYQQLQLMSTSNATSHIVGGSLFELHQHLFEIKVFAVDQDNSLLLT